MCHLLLVTWSSSRVSPGVRGDGDGDGDEGMGTGMMKGVGMDGMGVGMDGMGMGLKGDLVGELDFLLI